MEERDIDPIRRALKDARLSRRLTQQALAHRLGLRQRQISDLERATTDPRLSTVQDVARTLDLELVLIPRPLIAAVQALQRPSPNSGGRPMYALGLDGSE
jgi:transcriptional regulator with XRE-family HTH domain